MAEEAYAIWRTRCQPIHAGHVWAIERFFEYSKKNPDLTHQATNLVLAVVDPHLFLTEKEREKVPRCGRVMNPFCAPEVSAMISATKCERCGPLPDWKKVFVVSIPSFPSLRKASRRQAVREMKSRLGLESGKAGIWYFPVFDQEDVDDIEILWEEVGADQKVILSHNEAFQYDLRHPADIDGRKLGLYAASLARLLPGFTIEHGDGTRVTDIVPKVAQECIASVGEALVARLLQAAQAIMRDIPKHPLRDSHAFEFVAWADALRAVQAHWGNHCENKAKARSRFNDQVRWLRDA